MPTSQKAMMRRMAVRASGRRRAARRAFSSSREALEVALRPSLPAPAGASLKDEIAALQARAHSEELRSALQAKVDKGGGGAGAGDVAAVARLVRVNEADVRVLAGQRLHVERVRKSFSFDLDRAERGGRGEPPEGSERDVRVDFEWERELDRVGRGVDRFSGTVRLAGGDVLTFNSEDNEAHVSALEWLVYQALEGAGRIDPDLPDEESRRLLREKRPAVDWLLAFLCAHPSDYAFDEVSAVLRHDDLDEADMAELGAEMDEAGGAAGGGDGGGDGASPLEDESLSEVREAMMRDLAKDEDAIDRIREANDSKK